jgi:aminoglycoside phosphotransferase (APT) family kinase protein
LQSLTEPRPPLSLADVTPAWLTAALAERYPGIVVKDASFGDPIHGTGTNVAVRLEYATLPRAGAGTPRRLWLKTCFEPHFAAMAPSRVFEMEPLFYRELASRLPVRVPTCHYAGADAETHQGVVLLEDLAEAGVHFGNATRPITPEAAAACLSLLARLHAATWGKTWPLDLWYVTPGIPTAGAGAAWFSEQTPEVFASYLAARADANTPASVANPYRIVRAFQALAAMSHDAPCCLIHADAHLDNFYFGAHDSPGLMDWQAPRFGCWAWDVSYFIISALDIPVRRASECALLRHYLAELRAYGATAPGWDEAWLAYRRYNAYGLFVKIVNPDIFKPRAINVAWMSRHVAATEDLETFESLGV